MEQITEEQLLAIRDRQEAWLKSQPGVVGTGVGMDKGGTVCLKVFTRSATPATHEAIRRRLGDLPVAIEEVGDIRLQDSQRPAQSPGKIEPHSDEPPE